MGVWNTILPVRIIAEVAGMRKVTGLTEGLIVCF